MSEFQEPLCRTDWSTPLRGNPGFFLYTITLFLTFIPETFLNFILKSSKKDNLYHYIILLILPGTKLEGFLYSFSLVATVDSSSCGISACCSILEWTLAISVSCVWFVMPEKCCARLFAMLFGDLSGSSWVICQSSTGLSSSLLSIEYQPAPLPIAFSLFVSFSKYSFFLVERVFFMALSKDFQH